MRIIKRKGFNYIIHSFRKDKKIVTHEKYLN